MGENAIELIIMAATIIIRLLWGHTPGNKAYNNQLT